MESGEFVGVGGALTMTRSGNTNVPCEPFCWGHVRVAGSKTPKTVRHSGDAGIKSARGPRKKGKGKARNSGFTMTVIL